jgi:hypothetical protein
MVGTFKEGAYDYSLQRMTKVIRINGKTTEPYND